MEIRSVAHRSGLYDQTVELRRRILRLPLGLDFSESELDAESSETHLAAIVDGRVVGCLVMVPKPDGIVKMRQVAIEPQMQGQGIGAQLVAASEEWATQSGFNRIELSARDTAVGFYEHLNYDIIGDPFVEVTISHRKMIKLLTPSNPISQ